MPSTGLALVLPGLASSVIVAALLDLPILRLRSGRWEFPSGAILTGMLVAMIVSAHEPWFVAATTSAIAIASKYVFRGRMANIFNPAALAIVVTTHLFQSGQSWWGAIPDAHAAYSLAVLLIAGAFIAERVNKIPFVLSFLGVYFLLFSSAAFGGEPRLVAEIFRTPDLNAVLFFSFFILTDPPTSPTKYRDQVTCGALVAVASFAVFELTGAVYYLLAGVLVGNVWEAWRRRRNRAAHRRSSTHV